MDIVLGILLMLGYWFGRLEGKVILLRVDWVFFVKGIEI